MSDEMLEVISVEPDVYLVEWMTEQRFSKFEGNALITEWKSVNGFYHMVFTNKREAEAYAESESANSVWRDLSDAITFLGNRVVPLARIPF